LSYLVLRGRCRSCGGAISPRYPAVELTSGLLSTALFFGFGTGPSYFFYLAFFSVLIVVSFIDLRHQIIPDVLSIPGLLLGLAFSLTPWSEITWPDALVGAAGGGGFLLAVAVGFERLTRKEGMGMGDVKLLSMIGAWLGWRALPFVVLISSVSGIVLGGGALLLARRGLKVRIPFGPFLAVGALIHFFFGSRLLEFYLGLL
jgi:leader peptidase (prepilin peptidase)/N-methyltransferase